MESSGRMAQRNDLNSTALAVAKVERLWTAQQTAEFLGTSTAALYQRRWRQQGPPAYRIGNGLRYDPDDVRRWFRDRADTAN